MDPQEKRLLAGAVFVLAVTIGFAFTPYNGSNPRPGGASPGTPAGAIPADEAAFVAAARATQSIYAQAANAADKVQATRRQSLCRALQPSYAADSWIGTLKSFSSNGAGKGVLEIEVAPRISLGTWNNAFSDSVYRTLLDPNSAVFKTAEYLHAGAKVVFSGRFFPSGKDCVRERSVTLHGSLSEPAFLMRITALAPLGAAAPGAGDNVSGAAMAVVTQFYQDLERQDGKAASNTIVPEKRFQGPLSASALTQYFSNGASPLRLEYVQQLSGNSVQARYSYTGMSEAACAGISTATVTRRGSQVLIDAIAAKEQCAVPR
jgi:hypothetical protein